MKRYKMKVSEPTWKWECNRIINIKRGEREVVRWKGRHDWNDSTIFELLKCQSDYMWAAGTHTHIYNEWMIPLSDRTFVRSRSLSLPHFCCHGKNIYFYHVHHLIFISFCLLFRFVLSGIVQFILIRAQFEIGFYFFIVHTRRLQINK